MARRLEKWTFYIGNLGDQSSLDFLLGLLKRAASAGYTAVVLQDDRMCRINEVGTKYLENVKKFLCCAASEHMEIIPVICPIGNSNALLWHDVNLTEAVPVRKLPLIVNQGRIVPRNAASTGYGTASRISRVKSISSAIELELSVHPFRQYRFSFEARGRRIGPIQIRVSSDGRLLFLTRARVSTKWNAFGASFNPLWSHSLRLQIEVLDQNNWIDIRAPSIDEIAFLNIVRRDGAPLKMTRESGEVLDEQSDFTKIVDVRTQMALRENIIGEWHEPPHVFTSMPEGTLLTADYYHANPVDGKLMICPSEPCCIELIERHIDSTHRLFHAKRYLVNCDEIRTFNWCRACEDRKMNANGLLIECIQAVFRLIRTSAPLAATYIWSDMFDPYHNARDDYYCVRGTLSGGLKALSSDVGIVNWNFGARERSLAFFANEHNRIVVASYYDGAHDTQSWISACEIHAKFIDAFMYTTWTQNYTKLEEFAKVVDSLTTGWYGDQN